MKSSKTKKRLDYIGVYIILLILLLLCVIPFYLMIVNSTHGSFEIVTKLNLGIGNKLAENYADMQANVNIWRGFLNSLIISVFSTILVAYFGTLTAYGFAKFQFPGKGILFGIVLGSMMIPAQLSIIGFYQLCLKLKMLNTYWPFIIPGIANATTVFFLRGIIEKSIPDSLIEAARLEGCSEIGIFNKLILPCCIPGVVTMCIFNFVSSWNNYMGPLVILNRNEKYTLPVMISMIKGLYQYDYGAMYLAIAISVVPIIIVYCVLSRYIIDGLTAGAVK